MPPQRPIRIAACALALAAALLVAGCGGSSGQGTKEPAREGLAIPLGGVEYNVFLTREINPRIAEDKAYYSGPEAPRGSALYAVFVQACNAGKREVRTASDFTVTDNQGTRFKPLALPKSNPFAYRPTLLQADTCEPQVGSVAQLGPTAGSLLLFEFPLSNTENRPLELEVRGPFDALAGRRKSIRFTLDI